MEFVETSVFTRQVTGLMRDDEYCRVQLRLRENPKAGAVIQGTGGVRKIRSAMEGRGKSGGARFIYFYFEERDLILMILAYPKNELDTLNHEQKKAVRTIAERFHDER
jgi:hypothetical protein